MQFPFCVYDVHVILQLYIFVCTVYMYMYMHKWSYMYEAFVLGGNLWWPRVYTVSSFLCMSPGS